MKIMVINGPNLNMLGTREVGVYGNKSLTEINLDLKMFANGQDINVEFYQSNIEGELINALHKAHFQKFDGVVLNAGAYTHYSYAILDAIKAIDVPVVEVHLSNIDARDDFRKVSVISEACVGKIQGFGDKSYELAIDALVGVIK